MSTRSKSNPRKHPNLLYDSSFQVVRVQKTRSTRQPQRMAIRARSVPPTASHPWTYHRRIPTHTTRTIMPTITTTINTNSRRASSSSNKHRTHHQLTTRATTCSATGWVRPSPRCARSAKSSRPREPPPQPWQRAAATTAPVRRQPFPSRTWCTQSPRPSSLVSARSSCSALAAYPRAVLS